MAINRKKVEEILSREVTQKEIHESLSTPGRAETIREREAILWLADRVDEIVKNYNIHGHGYDNLLPDYPIEDFDEDREVRFFKLGE